MSRLAAVVAAVVLVLAGCASETPLDSKIGQVKVAHHTPEDCGFDWRYNFNTDGYDWVYDCTDPEWTFAIQWRPQRFRDDETNKVRTQPAYFESGFDVDQGLYETCQPGDWIEVNTNGDVVGCTATMPENMGGNL